MAVNIDVVQYLGGEGLDKHVYVHVDAEPGLLTTTKFRSTAAVETTLNVFALPACLLSGC